MSQVPPTDRTIRQSAGYVPADPAIYADRLYPDPPTGKPPLVMVHGAGHTGACYRATPDGRPGWASIFAGFGYPVIVPDWPGMGRSGWKDYDELTGELVCAALGSVIDGLDAPCVLLTHSMSGPYGWRLAETHAGRILAVIGVAPGPPGNIQPAPEILAEGDGFVEVMSGKFRRRLPFDRPSVFGDRLIRDKLIGDGDRFPMDDFETYARSLTGTPPRLFIERCNVDGSQIKIADPAKLKGKPMLVVSSDHDPDHTPEIDGAIAVWLNSIGAAADYWYLPEHGISGNGHMMMLENNNAEIASLIAGWIEKQL
jgi:pimeloyl-ACP methyl ester carboxylesterase